MDRMDTIGRADQHMIVTIDRNVITRIPRFSASHDNHRTWFLHLRGAQPEDAGRYMCQVNSNPMITQFGIIDVVGTRSNVNLDVNGESLRLRFICFQFRRPSWIQRAQHLISQSARVRK